MSAENQTTAGRGGWRAGSGRKKGSKNKAPQYRPVAGVESAKTTATAALRNVFDDRLPDSQLSPLELGAREFGRGVIRDLGGAGAVSMTRAAQVKIATRSLVILALLDRHVADLIGTTGIVDKAFHRALPIVADRQRLADSLTRQLQAIGFDRVRPVQTIEAVLRDIQEQAGRQQAADGAQDGAPGGAPDGGGA